MFVALAIIQQTRSRIALFAGVLACLVIGAPITLSSSGTKIGNVDFPVFASTMTISGPADKRFTLNKILKRVQRYSEDGHFEVGWFVDHHKGPISIGVTEDEKIIVVSGWNYRADFFEPESLSEEIMLFCIAFEA
jgi:hypothetical protein